MSSHISSTNPHPISPLKALLAVIVVAFTLTGCIKSNVDMTVKSNDKVDGRFVFALTDKLLTVSGKSRDAGVKQMQDEVAKSTSKLPKGVTTKIYDKGGFVGQEVNFTGLTADEFNKVTADASSAATAVIGAGGPGVLLVKKNGNWEFSGTLDLSAAEGLDKSGFGAVGNIKPDVRVAVAFPGKIMTKDKWARVSGKTVTWTPNLGEKVVMKVVAKTS